MLGRFIFPLTFLTKGKNKTTLLKFTERILHYHVELDEHICRILVLVRSLSVARKLFAPRALASPFNVVGKVIWPKFMSELKSVTVIFSHNLLNLLVLQQFPKTLTG
jgi:hypothetical protein